MYSELLTLTDNKATYEQFLDIEAVYMKKDSMTKAQAASLWKRRHGEKINKPRAEEMRRIKEAIRDFKKEREWFKTMEQRINKGHDEMITEQIINHYGKTLEEINAEPRDSAIKWLAQQTLDRIEKSRSQAIYKWYEDAGNDTTIYIIYKDGSTLYVSGTEIVSGDVTPKMNNIAYALYMDGWEHFDTEIGDIDKGLFGRTAEDYDYEMTDEMYEIKEQYERNIEIKYRTAWGLKQQTA